MALELYRDEDINAVQAQIWIAVCVYLLVITARKRLNVPASPQILLNLFEVDMFDKAPINQTVENAMLKLDDLPINNQLNLLDF